jgi:hypothetical protein
VAFDQITVNPKKSEPPGWDRGSPWTRQDAGAVGRASARHVDRPDAGGGVARRYRLDRLHCLEQRGIELADSGNTADPVLLTPPDSGASVSELAGCEKSSPWPVGAVPMPWCVATFRRSLKITDLGALRRHGYFSLPPAGFFGLPVVSFFGRSVAAIL